MMRIMLKSKLYYVTITDVQLHYQGSICIDESLMQEADLYEGERVDVLNLNNGARLQTYVIKGEKNSGSICLNGPAARLGMAGDKIVILSYAFYNKEEISRLKVKYVQVDDTNKIKNSYMACCCTT